MKAKKILYVDPLCYKAHSYYNKRNIELLCDLCDLDVLFIDGYINTEGLNIHESLIYKTQLKYFPEHNFVKNYLLKRIVHKIGIIKIMNEIKQIIKGRKYDYVIFSCCDIIAFAMTMKHVKQNMAVVHHGIFRVNESNVVMHFFKKTNRMAQFVVFEDFIKDYLIDNVKIKNEVKVLHHPICCDNIINESNIKDSKTIELFAPSHANSEMIVEAIVNGFDCIKNKVELCIRGNNDCITDSLKMYSTMYISREEYVSRFANADYIVVPYDKNYNYRVSGVLFDAFVRKKRVILFGGNTLKYYAEKYPNIVTVVNDVSEFFEYILSLSREKIKSQYNENFYADCERFYADYSDEAITNDFQKLLKGIPS